MPSISGFIGLVAVILHTKIVLLIYWYISYIVELVLTLNIHLIFDVGRVITNSQYLTSACNYQLSLIDVGV